MDTTPIPQVIDKNSNRKFTTLPILTKFEIARLLAIRTAQLADGSKAMFDISDFKHKDDIYQIALSEYDKGLIPLIIKRVLPNNDFEEIPVDELSKKKN